jgi:AcrR family transcriptional regulator
VSPAADEASGAGAKRVRARRGEGERLRQEILDATIALIVEAGSVDKVSTRAVARRVGCTPPALYLHFPDKASLIYAACERQFEKLGVLLNEAMAGLDHPCDRLAAAAHAYVHFALDHPEEYRVMMLDLAPSSMYEATLEDMAGSPGFDAIVETVTDGIERGYYRPVDPTLAALMLWASVHGLVSLRLVKGGLALPDIDVLLDEALSLSLVGLQAPDAPDAPVHSQP